MGTQSTWGQYSPDTSLTHRHSSIMASPCNCTGRPEGRRLLRADLRKISYYYDDERRDDIVEAEVKDMFRDFLLVNPDGNVSREDFLFTLEEMEMDSFKQGLEKEGRSLRSTCSKPLTKTVTVTSASWSGPCVVSL